MRTRVFSITRSRAQNRRVIVARAAIAGVVCLLGLMAATPSYAKGRWYFDIGGGTGLVANPTALLPGANTGVSGVGTGALMHDFQQHGAIFSFQIGLSERYVMLGGYSFLTSNILTRYEVGPIFFGLGASPYIMAEGGKLGGSLTHTPGYSFLGEGGFDWKIIPTFSITVSGALEFVSAGGSLGPAPSIEGIACFRFYFGDRYDAAKRREYDGDGWRYPRGIEIR